MGAKTEVIKKALMWGLPLLGVAAAAKTKGGGATYDPNQPKARDGAPRPSADKDFQDARFACESLVPGSCTAEDVQDWVWSYYMNGILPMTKVAQALSEVAPVDNEDAQYLIAQSNAVLFKFQETYPGWTPEQTTVPVATGYEFTLIQEINGNIDVAIALRKDMLREYKRISPNTVPAGATPGDVKDLQQADTGSSAPYAAAGAVVGLGIALAFVVAANNKKRQPTV